MKWIMIIPILLMVLTGCEKELQDQYITDIDGNRYDLIQIGTQTWMAENLKVTRDNDGNQLETYCYSDKPAKGEEFGRLYPWREALNACPDGWRLPTITDWDELQITLGMDPDEAVDFGWRGTDQGTQLKEGGSSGFNALLAGYKDGIIEWDGRYFDIGYYGTFWSANEHDSINSISYWVYSAYGKVYKGAYDNTSAFSVRCVKDE